MIKEKKGINLKSSKVRSLSILIFLLYFQLIGNKPALGQNTNWIASQILELFRNAPWKIGHLHLYRAFNLNNAGYDSDIYYGYMGKTYPDFTLFVGPAFQALIPLQKLIILDSYQSLQGAFYLKNEKERALNFSTSNQVHFLAKKMYGRTGLSYYNLRDRFSPELTARVRHEEVAWNGFLMLYLNRSISTAWQVQASSFNYSHIALGNQYVDQILNRYQYSFDYFIFFRTNQKWQYYLNLQSGFYKFKKPESKFKNARYLAVYGGLEFLPVKKGERSMFSGNVNIGFKHLKPENPEFKPTKSLVGDGLLALNLSRFLNWQIYYHRDYDVSIYSSLLQYLQTTFGTSLVFRISNGLTLTNQITEGLTTYPFSSESGSGEQKIKFYMFSSNLIARVNRDLSFNFMVDFGSRITYPVQIKFSRQFFGLGLTYGSVPGIKTKPDFTWY